MKDVRQRLQNLAAMRASYTNQLAEVRERTNSLTRAQQELNSARASLAAGDVTTLVTRVDTPRTGPYPQGPGRSTIAAAAGAGGLLMGIGLLILTLPAPATPVTPAPSPAVQSVREEVPPPPNPAAATTPPAPTVRPPTPRPKPVVVPAGRSMTLREALARCSDMEDPWT
jgi:hypothetical protein